MEVLKNKRVHFYYRKHTKQRFKERFSDLPELSDEDYNIIKSMAKNSRLVIGKHKKLIVYKNVPMWCILSNSKNVKTIFPVKKSFLKKIKKIEIIGLDLTKINIEKFNEFVSNNQSNDIECVKIPMDIGLNLIDDAQMKF